MGEDTKTSNRGCQIYPSSIEKQSCGLSDEEELWALERGTATAKDQLSREKYRD